MRGAEVDADGVFRLAHSSTSAGAITRVSCPSVRAGQAHGGGAPALVLQRAGERRLADHVAGDAHGGGVEAGRQGQAAAFGFGAHGFEIERVLQHLARAAVQQARGAAHVGIGIGADVFLQEIDEARFALQQGEQLQGGIDVGGGAHGRGGGTGAGGGAPARGPVRERAAALRWPAARRCAAPVRARPGGRRPAGRRSCRWPGERRERKGSSWGSVMGLWWRQGRDGQRVGRPGAGPYDRYCHQCGKAVVKPEDCARRCRGWAPGMGAGRCGLATSFTEAVQLHKYK